jgi:hypothetical protein
MSGIWLGLLLASVQESSAPEFTKFDIVRERVGHKVVVDAVLLNPMPAAIEDGKVVVLYFDGDDELKRSAPVPVPKLAPGKSAPFRIEVLQLPNFSRYEIYLQYRGTTRLYLGADPAKLPALRRPSPARLALEGRNDAFAGGVFRSGVVVSNRGETEGDEPTLKLEFCASTGRVLKEAWVPLGPVLEPASEDSFEIAVPGVPAFETVKAALFWRVAAGLDLGDSGSPLSGDLVLLNCKVDRLNGGVARVSGVLLNGRPAAVSKVQANFRLGRLEVPYLLPGVLRPGERRAFQVHVSDCPPLDSAGFSLAFEGAGKEDPAAAPAAIPESKRVSSRSLDVGQVRIPPVPEKSAEVKAAEAGKTPAGYKAEIRGLLVVDGERSAGGKYSGDVYLFRVAFTDAKGLKVQPTGTFTGTIYDGPKPLKKIQRIVARESWKVDAARVNSQTVADNTIACDRKTGELWVAFHRSEGPFEKPRADLEFKVSGMGTWTWSGLSDKWQNAPRWPEPEKN